MQSMRRHQLTRTILALSLAALGSATGVSANDTLVGTNPASKIDPQLLNVQLKSGLQEALI